MDFEWDETKAESNFRKHGIDFEEAALVFFDPYRIETLDERPDHEEDRFRTVCMAAGRLLFVVYTEREGRLRIISARRATRNEKRTYEDTIES